MVTGLAINKAISIYIGPSGLALIGQFQNFMELVMTMAQGAINSGVTKYTAEYGKESDHIPLLFSTASKIILSASFFVGIVVVTFSNEASIRFLKNEEYQYIFVVFGFTVVLFAINSFLLAIINGLKEVKTWVKISIVQSAYGLIFTTSLIVWFGLDGALLALATNQSIIFLIVLWMLRKHPIITLSNFRKRFDSPEAKKLAKFALMALVSAIAAPISQLLLRNHIGGSLDWNQAGYWQAIWHISSMYLLVIVSTISIYYLPRLSEITNKAELRQELLKGYQILLPLVAILSIMIYMLKDYIIILLFTEEFLPIKELFLWQLIGDVIKISAFLLSYLMIAKAMAKVFIVTEIIFSINFVMLGFIFINSHGLIGITYAFALNYFMYLITMIFVTRKHWI